MAKQIFKILGMNCSSCAKVIKFGLEGNEGIKSVDVDFISAKAYLEFDSVKTNINNIKSKIENLGYKAIIG